MRAIYYLWLFINILLSNFSKRLENFFFFYNNDRLYRFNNLNVFQRLFLIFFYNSNYYSRLKLSYKDSSKLGIDRLKNYRNIHNFMAYTESNNKLNTNKSKIKTKYSFIKLAYGNSMINPKFSQTEMLTTIILFTKLNRAIKNYKLNFFWETLVPKNSSVINVIVTKRLKSHVLSTVSYYRYNITTLSGFNSFIANLSEFKLKFEDNSLNDRQLKLLAIDVNKNNYINKIIEKKQKKYVLVLNQYKKFYNSIFNDNVFNIASNKILHLYYKNVNTNNITLKKNFLDFYKSFLSINHIPTDVSKYFSYKSNVTTLFIRKNKIFNKGRYSRNRQLYRTGVYWCLILNILGVFGLYYYFYRFTFNFGYFWIPMCILILSIFGSRLVKYRLYNVTNVLTEIKLFINLLDSFLHSILVNTFIRFKKFMIKMYYITRFKLRFTYINTKYFLKNFWKSL